MSKSSRRLRYFLCLLGFWTGFLKAHGQVIEQNIPDFHPRYKLVATVPGAILDVRDYEILYRDIDNAVLSTNLITHATAIYLTNASGHGPIFFTPTGVFAFGSPALQIDGQEQISLGECSAGAPDFADHIIDGRFGILHMADGVFLRDFVARTNSLISPAADFLDVASNGNVVFTTTANQTNFAVRWLHDGETTTLALLPNYPTPFVATDGTNVLWSEAAQTLAGPLGSVYLQTPSEKIALSTNTYLVSAPPMRMTAPHSGVVAMNNGWVIFPRQTTAPFAGRNDLWRRAPDGSISQLTTVAATVHAMRSDGAALISDSSLQYVPANGPTKVISGDSAANYFIAGDHFYAYGISPLHDGTRIYELEVDQDPFGVMFPSYNADTGELSFYLMSGAPVGDYELQRTANFIDWTSIVTITATSADVKNGMQMRVTTSPGYFRLRKI